MAQRQKGQGTPKGSATKTALPVLLGCSFSASFSQSMMNIALPEAAERFQVTLSQANWLIVGYMVIAATSIMLAPVLLRRLGVRRVFFLGGTMLAAGSILALFAPNFWVLLLCRLMQAVCTGLFYPLVTSAIMTDAPRKSLGAHLSMNSGVIAIGLAVSPMISGFMLTRFGWSTMFAVPLVLAVLLLTVGFFLVRGKREATCVVVDPLSVVLGLVGLSAFMYGLGEVTHDPAPSVVALVVGAVVLGLFAWRQFSLKNPLLNLRPLSHGKFAFGIVLVMVGMLTSSAMSVLLPLYYEGALEHTAFAAGALLLGPVMANAVFAYLGGRLYDRYGIWPLVPLGMVLVLAGQAGALFTAEGLVLLLVVLSSVLVYAGVGLVVPVSKTTALDQLPADLYPHGASINSTAVQISSAIGSSLFVGVLSADVLRDTAAGAMKVQAYATGFAHTLTIALGISLAGLVLALFYAHAMRKRGTHK